ncbi:DUF4097 family beta strand repeat-containing protein [Pseudofulvimonas gallinarii]|uniref:Putative adhesin n=1 Tax=Pseudofulvimonas gallinarii TaxID=634155 RepID=A0A4S3KZF9_9GAMM|nr:DUF4097 family beta strand repeat-containing protein [Pseudofulvimonas gallinarii]TCS99175.1 putative adhesin [Pseudofulvimonas gallinarii]THD14018.1 hypothetical protein B1808_05895 [Pseudofulvimonas gallinarii]
MLDRIALLLLLSAATAGARAGTPIDETRPGQAGMHLRVESVAGSVRLTPGSDSQVVIRGTLGDGSKPLRIDGDGSRLSIQVEAESNGWGSRMAPSTLEIEVPSTARVEINTVSADVGVSGIGGSEARIETVSGAIDYRGSGERVRLKTVSGRIHGEGSGRHWTVGSVSGSITMPEASGELDVESISGTIDVAFRPASRVHVETVSGRIEATGVLADGGDIDMQSVSGALNLRLSGQTDARIQAKTFSGKVESDFGTVERGGFGGGYSLDTRVGSGAGTVRVESFSGKVTIRGN